MTRLRVGSRQAAGDSEKGTLNLLIYPRVCLILHSLFLNVVILIVESACDVAIVKFVGDLSIIQNLKIKEFTLWPVNI